MFNIAKPDLGELPSLAQLRRYTYAAIICAGLILVAVVLPAERGMDPTGAGHWLGLTEMGEIKQELKHEAELDDHGDSQSFNLLDSILGVFFGSAYAQETWKETITFTVEPGDHTETKLLMSEGAEANYVWTVTGGRINFDLHGHGAGEGQSKTYEKGRGATGGVGGIVALFEGEHGWFWRNRDKSAVTIMLKLNGDYLGIVRSE